MPGQTTDIKVQLPGEGGASGPLQLRFIDISGGAGTLYAMATALVGASGNEVDVDSSGALKSDIGSSSVTQTGAVTSTGPVDASGAITVTTGQLGDGGASKAIIPVGTITSTVISAASGRLARVIVTALGVTPPVFTDGLLSLAFIPASAPIGSIYEVQIPIATGITLTGNATNPGLIVTYD